MRTKMFVFNILFVISLYIVPPLYKAPELQQPVVTTVKQVEEVAQVEDFYSEVKDDVIVFRGTQKEYKILVPQASAGYTIVAYDELWLEVVVSEQKMYLYRGINVIQEFIVSTGFVNTQYETPPGIYEIYWKTPFQYMSSDTYGTLDVPHVMYFFHGYAIHSANWHNNFGQPMSRGCVNVKPLEAEFLYNLLDVGTQVIVWEEK